MKHQNQSAPEFMTVKLEDLSSSGEAVGRLPEGKVAFVQGGAPGDVVVFQVHEEHKGFIRGTLLSIKEPGFTRVKPSCPLAQNFLCGGCPFMHIQSKVQKEAKENFVRRAFRHTQALIHPILTPTQDLNYRIRARLIRRNGILGFQAARSHRVTEVPTCAVLLPALDQVLTRLAKALQPLVGEEGSLSGVLGIESKIHLAVTLGEGGDKEAIRAVFAKEIAAGTIVGACIGEESLGQAAVNVGDEAFPVWASADTFAQASEAGHSSLPKLVAQVAAAPLLDSFAGPLSTVLELHAGAGNLTRYLVGLAKRVVAVESDPRSALRLRQIWGEKVQVYGVPDEVAVRALIRGREKIPVIVLDPPRTGAKEIMLELPKLSPQRLVYVSCDPMTLARDAALLKAQGFVVKEVFPMDLMPQTPHVEMVAVIEKL